VVLTRKTVVYRTALDRCTAYKLFYSCQSLLAAAGLGPNHPLLTDIAFCLAIHAYKRSVRTQGTGALEVLLSDSH
jgi:hypothetical protein